MKVYLKNPKATEEFGYRLGKLLCDGDVICLNGDLGAGKTLLTKGIAHAFGISENEVTSPTFNLMNIYNGKKEIRHFDFYRLETKEELDDIGFEEFCGTTGITVIEWADMFKECLPHEYLQILLTYDENGRQAELCNHGIHYEKIVKELENADLGN